jgi:hypothetical protein
LEYLKQSDPVRSSLEVSSSAISALVILSTTTVSYNAYFTKSIQGPVMHFAAVPGVLGMLYLVTAVWGFQQVNTKRSRQANKLVKLRLQLQMEISSLSQVEQDKLQLLLRCMIGDLQADEEIAHLQIFGVPADTKMLYSVFVLVVNAFFAATRDRLRAAACLPVGRLGRVLSLVHANPGLHAGEHLGYVITTGGVLGPGFEQLLLDEIAEEGLRKRPSDTPSPAR